MPDAETEASSAPRFEPDERWVPADERWFGLDRRTLRPTLVVFALVILMSVVLPVINATAPYHDLVRAGDVVELEGDVTFVPEAGWAITSGVRAGKAPLSGLYPATATVEHGANKFTLRTGSFHGDADKLLDQIETTSDALNSSRGVHVTGEPVTIVTDQGKQGATVRVTGPHTAGVIAAFVFGNRGVEHRGVADDRQHQQFRRGKAVTTTTLDHLDRARDVALDLSGWGRRFFFYQPRNLAFWGYLALVGIGVLTFFSTLAREYNAYGAAIGLAVTSFAIYAALFWWFTDRIDHYAKLPHKLMVVAFLWGGFAAPWTMAANANDAILALYAKTFGQVWALNWGAGLAAPFNEEVAKGSGLLLLIALAQRHIRTAFDGFILGAFIGLGFQIVEDISYAMTSAGTQFGANQIGASVSTIILRMVSGVAAHILYSAIFCAGVVYLVGRPAEPRKIGRGLLLIAIPMLLHGTWDSLDAIAGPSALTLIGLLIATIVIALHIVARVYRLTVTRERDFVRDVMAPEQARNVIAPIELDAMAGNRKARKAYRKAGRNRGERRRARYILNAAYALSDELAAARGADTDRVRFARSEVARIRAGLPSPW